LLRAPLLLLHNPALEPDPKSFFPTRGIYGRSATKVEAPHDSRWGTGSTNPVFSPDGETLAFTGEYDGNIDLYTMPAAGGVPKRITYHPAADYAVGWTSDGQRILFRSARKSFSHFTQLFTVAAAGGLAQTVPLPMAFAGTYSPDGKRMVYSPLDGGQFGRTPERWVAWNRYRGGDASYLWIANLADLSTEKIPRTDSNDINPMWVGDKIYIPFRPERPDDVVQL
jgi:tricorn protease